VFGFPHSVQWDAITGGLCGHFCELYEEEEENQVQM